MNFYLYVVPWDSLLCKHQYILQSNLFVICYNEISFRYFLIQRRFTSYLDTRPETITYTIIHAHNKPIHMIHAHVYYSHVPHLISGLLTTSHTVTMLHKDGNMLFFHTLALGLKFMHTARSVDKYVPSPYIPI